MKILAILAIILLVGSLGAVWETCVYDDYTWRCYLEPNIVCNYAGCFDHNVAGERIFYKNNHKFSYDPATDILKMLPCQTYVLVVGGHVLRDRGGEPFITEEIYECKELKNHD